MSSSADKWHFIFDCRILVLLRLSGILTWKLDDFKRNLLPLRIVSVSAVIVHFCKARRSTHRKISFFGWDREPVIIYPKKNSFLFHCILPLATSTWIIMATCINLGNNYCPKASLFRLQAPRLWMIRVPLSCCFVQRWRDQLCWKNRAITDKEIIQPSLRWWAYRWAGSSGMLIVTVWLTADVKFCIRSKIVKRFTMWYHHSTCR